MDSDANIDDIIVSDNMIDMIIDGTIADTDTLTVSYTASENGSIDDLATNQLADFADRLITNELDTTPPTPTVSNGDISLTNQSPLPFTVRFDESVTGLAEDEITVNGPARVVPGSLAPVNTTHYNFDVERVDSDGEITDSLPMAPQLMRQNPSTTCRIYIRHHAADGDWRFHTGQQYHYTGDIRRRNGR